MSATGGSPPRVLVASEAGLRIRAMGDVMDVISAAYDADALVLTAADVDPGFFDLGTGLAGELFQKVTNYGLRLALVLLDPAAHCPRWSDLAFEHARHHVVRIVRSVPSRPVPQSRVPPAPSFDAPTASLDVELNARVDPRALRYWTQLLKGEAVFRGVPMAGVRASVRAVWVAHDLDAWSIDGLLALAHRWFAGAASEEQQGGFGGRASVTGRYSPPMTSAAQHETRQRRVLRGRT